MLLTLYHIAQTMMISWMVWTTARTWMTSTLKNSTRSAKTGQLEKIEDLLEQFQAQVGKVRVRFNLVTRAGPPYLSVYINISFCLLYRTLGCSSAPCIPIIYRHLQNYSCFPLRIYKCSICFGEYLCQLWRVFGMLWSVPVSALESLWYALECTLESLWYALECTCVSFGESLEML